MSILRPGGFRNLFCGLFVSLSGMAWNATAGLAAVGIPAGAAITGVGPQTTVELGDAIVVWTVVLGFVFVTEVYQSLAMPAFSATLLALMGITG